MITNILKRETCANCLICCHYTDDDVWDAPGFTKKEFEENQKLQDDPRITKIGKFLRKTSLDELPQVLNILNNSMTIIRTSTSGRRRN